MKSRKALIVYLIRHGNKDYERHKKFPDEPIVLSDEGRMQAKFLAKRFRGMKIDRIISSDYERCVETAKPVAKILNLDLNLDKDLRELDVGFTNVSPEEMKRIGRAWNKIKKMSGQVIVVAHGGTNRVIMSLVLGASPDKMFFSQNPTGVNVIKINSEGRLGIVRVNDVEHLPEELRNSQC